MLKICKTCQNELSGKQRLYCSVSCKGKSHQYNSYKCQQERGSYRKKELVELSGGKCGVCGYCKNMSALCFHHKDPTKKEFGLDLRNLSNRSMRSVMQEYYKCDLLCLNCHSELHHPTHHINSNGGY